MLPVIALSDYFSTLTAPAQATIVSAMVSALVALVVAFYSPFSQRRLEHLKAELDILKGERASKRAYEYEARKRLYRAIGHLRFQLLLACRDCSRRIQRHGLVRQYDLSPQGYYGRTTIYRILRPLAILEIIERSVAVSDFSVDPEAQNLLRLKKSLVGMLSGDRIIGDYPEMDWSNEKQHVFRDSLRRLANFLVLKSETGTEAVMRFDEFEAAVHAAGWKATAPLDSIFKQFDLKASPVFWLRLVAYGHACNAFINRAGKNLGFEKCEFPTGQLLEQCGDPYISQNLESYLVKIEESAIVKL